MLEKVRSYIHSQGLLAAGDRVAVAVSAGADSVALLRALLELRGDLGIVLSVAHFNHMIRGPQAEADEAFVRELAQAHGLELHLDSADVPAHAEKLRLSLEAAGRELRYAWFRRLLAENVVDRLATAHTLDDQAETVLLRLLRGAGTRGLAAIFPAQSFEPGEVERRSPPQIVRPLLGVRRREVEEYLASLEQPWREDESNRDPRFVRNRIRHELLPLLERDYNPGLAVLLAETAEVMRADEEHWRRRVAELLPEVFTPDPPKRRAPPESPPPGGKLRLDALEKYSLALQRRLLRAAAEQLGLRLNFQQVDELLRLAFAKPRRTGRSYDLPHGWVARRGHRDLRFAPVGGAEPPPAPGGYHYRLPVPGEVSVPEIGTLIRASLVPFAAAESGYNRAQHLDPRALPGELVVRNWQPGDRFWPAHTKSPKKVKDLLQEKHVMRPERSLWPVVASGQTIIWVRGFQPPAQYRARAASPQGVRIEEIALAR